MTVVLQLLLLLGCDQGEFAKPASYVLNNPGVAVILGKSLIFDVIKKYECIAIQHSIEVKPWIVVG